jgi:hypothetical protein
MGERTYTISKQKDLPSVKKQCRMGVHRSMQGGAMKNRCVRMILRSAILGFSTGCALLSGAPSNLTRKTETPSPTTAVRNSSTYTASFSPSRTATIAPTRTASPSPTPVPTVAVTETCRSAIDGIDALKKNIGLPGHLRSGEPYRRAGDFDPNEYFSVLNHLQMEFGYTLDYVYYLDGAGSKPMLYARGIFVEPFRSYDDFVQSIGRKRSDERSVDVLPYAFDYLEKIQVDGSEEGYFQFYALAELGDQFYLSGKARYNDFIILCDLSDLTIVKQELSRNGIALPEDDWKRAESIDFRPTVSVDENAATVRLVIFSKWGGFWEEVVVMDKLRPWHLLYLEQNVYVSYGCGNPI